MKLFFGMILTAGLALAQEPSAPILSLTATADKVAGAPDSIRIDLFRWSTDAERDQFLSAWNLTNRPATGGRGGGRGAGGRGAAAAANPAPDSGAAADGAAAGRGTAAGGRGGRGGGRGGRGGAAAEAVPQTPEASLTAALSDAPTVGHLWSSEVAGYSVRSAVTLAQPDGGERIILITDRRLGAWNNLWKPVGADGAPNNYDFSVIEVHLNAKGEGEGKVSITGKVVADSAAKIIGLENYAALPVVLKNVKRK